MMGFSMNLCDHDDLFWHHNRREDGVQLGFLIWPSIETRENFIALQEVSLWTGVKYICLGDLGGEALKSDLIVCARFGEIH